MEMKPLNNLEWQPKALRARAEVVWVEVQEQKWKEIPQEQVPIRVSKRSFLRMRIGQVARRKRL